jgi:hypothetical protein
MTIYNKNIKIFLLLQLLFLLLQLIHDRSVPPVDFILQVANSVQLFMIPLGILFQPAIQI